ncbi:MAG TPA: YqgE/AlgH family protein [Burkholderiales bacterium]|jgi:putative transcriptional regulator|nr:YqgE/AlgH family protein [Burkholderiales bacterium]
MKRALVLLMLAAAAAAVQAADLSKPLILVAVPELHDPVYGATVIVVAPVGGDQHIGFIVNRPSDVTLGKIFPGDGPSQKVHEPVYLGGPYEPQLVFALVERAKNPGGKSLELMPGLFAAADAATVDTIIKGDAAKARFVAGLVAWKPGELEQELERKVWYVLEPDARLVLRKPANGLWEDLVRRSQNAANAI